LQAVYLQETSETQRSAYIHALSGFLTHDLSARRLYTSLIVRPQPYIHMYIRVSVCAPARARERLILIFSRLESKQDKKTFWTK
jgi:hypothetical protein